MVERTNINCVCVCVCQVDLSARPLKTLTLYEMLLDLMKDEEEAIEQIKGSFREVTTVTSVTAQSQFSRRSET